jgi:hypothetical protein
MPRRAGAEVSRSTISSFQHLALSGFTRPFGEWNVLQMDQAAFAHKELFGTSENAVKTQI